MENILTVGYHKGEMDFGVNGSIRDLTYPQMKEFREMCVVALGQAENMWRSSQEEKHPVGTNTPITNEDNLK